MIKDLPVAVWMLLSMMLGLAAGFSGYPMVFDIATVIGDAFFSVFKAISLPVIFLALVTAISGLAGTDQLRKMGGKVFGLSLLTTFISACVALLLYRICQPAMPHGPGTNVGPVSFDAYFASLKKVIPDNLLTPFLQGHSLAVIVMALATGLAVLTLPSTQRVNFHSFFSHVLALFMRFVAGITSLLPIGVFAFSCLFVKDLQGGTSIANLGLYLLAIVLANLVQAVLVLPLFLRKAGVPVIASFKGMWPALSLAFFTKSSCAAMPLAMCCAEKNLDVKEHVSRFSFPLCTSVNMNACAGFILITVLFVSESHGVSFDTWDLLKWTAIATIVAMGHAGVPMGCFFLASALVSQANLPLTLMGIILPFYTLLDMLESAINLWSDSCITLVLDRSSSSAPSPS